MRAKMWYPTADCEADHGKDACLVAGAFAQADAVDQPPEPLAIGTAIDVQLANWYRNSKLAAS
jgi:hypothetical protein